MDSLDRIRTMLKSGNETLTLNGSKTDFSLLDFWRWSVSDLVSNATRGRFAEFIVATGTGVNLQVCRDEWGAYDLRTPGGIKIEVKSTAYVQSWLQKTLSPIRFSIKAAYSWDDETNKRLDIASRSADVYVFCLFHHDKKQTCDPLNLDHWEFYVVATEELNRRTRSQHSITLNYLKLMTVIEFQVLLSISTRPMVIVLTSSFISYYCLHLYQYTFVFSAIY